MVNEGDASSTEGNGEQLPLDFLRDAFKKLDVRELCAASCVSKMWRSIAVEQWPQRCKMLWRLGWETISPACQGSHLRAYAARHKVMRQLV